MPSAGQGEAGIPEAAGANVITTTAIFFSSLHHSFFPCSIRNFRIILGLSTPLVHDNCRSLMLGEANLKEGNTSLGIPALFRRNTNECYYHGYGLQLHTIC